MTKFNNFDFKNFVKKYSKLKTTDFLKVMIKDVFHKKIAVTSSETLKYLKTVKKRLHLTNIKIFKPDQYYLKKYDPNGDLHKTNTNLCCHIRKVLPLRKSMKNYDAWINGRKRFHGFERLKLKKIEMINGLIKINPLVDWSFKQIKNYMLSNNLPEHPLLSEGYKSIGCQPCTNKSKDSIRDGRWSDSLKSECGIHVNEEEDKKYYPSV